MYVPSHNDGRVRLAATCMLNIMDFDALPYPNASAGSSYRFCNCGRKVSLLRFDLVVSVIVLRTGQYDVQHFDAFKTEFGGSKTCMAVLMERRGIFNS